MCNCEGHFLYAWTDKDVPLEPSVAEAKAAVLALENILSQGSFNIILEGDATDVLNPFIDKNHKAQWSLDPIICSLELLLANFPFCSKTCS